MVVKKKGAYPVQDLCLESIYIPISMLSLVLVRQWKGAMHLVFVSIRARWVHTFLFVAVASMHALSVACINE